MSHGRIMNLAPKVEYNGIKDGGMISIKRHHEQLQVLRSLNGLRNTIKHLGDRDLIKLQQAINEQLKKRNIDIDQTSAT